MRAFLPYSPRRATGHIVNTASMAGLAPGAGAATARASTPSWLTDDLYTGLRQAG
jgi:short-subunit dehydrogenase